MINQVHNMDRVLDLTFMVILGVSGIVINEATLTSLGSVGFVCGIVWWVGRKFQYIDDRIEELSKIVKSLPCNCQKKGPNDECGES